MLSCLADIGYTAGDASLIPLREQVLEWLVRRRPRVVKGGPVRVCCSIEGSAVWYLLKLGLADERVDSVVERMLEWHNQQIAIGILLQTLTSGEGIRSGSMALGRVHFDILLFGLECMKYDIESAVNSQIVRPLVDYNFGHSLYPQFSLGNINEKDIVQLSQAMNVLLSHKVVGPKEPVLREMFNLPPVEEDGRLTTDG